jgi:hypothetical protein
VVSSQQFSTNTWYQVTLVYDSTQSVAANRVKLYVNGQQITSFAAQTDPSQNFAGVATRRSDLWALSQAVGFSTAIWRTCSSSRGGR